MDNKRLASKLRALRKAHQYTQDYVASFLGVVRQTYSHYETGLRTPSYEALYKLAGLYNVSVEDLMHLAVELDKNEYYDAPRPTQSSQELAGYLDFLNDPKNRKKYQFHTKREKELLYYFSQLPEIEQEEMIAIARIKLQKIHQNVL
ncbi:MAG: helix-turn-helix domain-containing protein [Muribaculaceae bacterium]|nr:helix-turn-helix domain-containing protein [Roseburia sp.]MCM1430922.1 helix-turn-helix domain-containing protein [Muribaculaceae bacterium]MCM1491717.1 helix-turn-helix domain-containing protein [Muribaculaceae bacterium]